MLKKRQGKLDSVTHNFCSHKTVLMALQLMASDYTCWTIPWRIDNILFIYLLFKYI